MKKIEKRSKKGKRKIKRCIIVENKERILRNKECLIMYMLWRIKKDDWLNFIDIVNFSYVVLKNRYLFLLFIINILNSY